MTSPARVVAAALLALGLQTPQFRSGVDIVRFDVTVLDKDRHPVAGLTAQDFLVTENGRPLRIAGFEAVTIPGNETAALAAAAAPAPAASDLRTEAVTNHRDVPGRLVLIVIDRSVGYEQSVVSARRIANAAIDALGPNDLAAVVFTSGITGNRLQGLTANRDRLRAAVASAQMGTPTNVEMTFDGLRRTGPNLPQGECYCGVCTMQTLAGIADSVAAILNYKKIILYVGEDLAFSETAAAGRASGCQGLFLEARERLMQAIDRSSITVHAFNPRGLETGQLGADAFRADTKESASDRSAREGSLRNLPEYTGGRAFVSLNQPERFIPAVFEESRIYYVLAIERAPSAGKGRPHHLQIDVDRANTSVVSRTTYLDAAAETAKKAAGDPLAKALAEVLPLTGLPLRMKLSPGTTKNSSLTATLATPLAADARADVLIGVFDQFGGQVGWERAKVELPARNGDDVEWTMHLNPRPGHYDVRAAVRIGDAIGSVAGSIDVAPALRSDAKANASAAPVAGTASGAVPPGAAPDGTPRSAALDALLTAAGGFVEQYGDPGGGLVLDELYRQDVMSSALGTRVLKSELLVMPDQAEGWVQFRDVLSADGKKVADRDDRLARLFSQPAEDPRGQARRIAEESARYNFDSSVVAIKRSLNQPLAALLYLRPINQPRSTFALEAREGDAQHLTFREQQQPTLIGTTGDAGATGDFLIVPATGQVRRALLRVVSRTAKVTVTASIRVRYELDAKTGLMLPAEMSERYEARDARGNLLDVILGDARYSNPRQFKVHADK